MSELIRCESEPWVTIVIVNWNKRHYVLNLLDSLSSIDYSNRNIVIVDNASTDGSVQALKEHSLDVILLENSENMGGTGGFNTGMDYALSHLNQAYLWLLDNDAEVLPGTLKGLVAVMEQDRSLGVAGSCILSPEDHSLIVEAGASVGWRTGTSDPHLRYSKLDSYDGPRVFDVDSVAACSALVRESVVRRTGLMDERFFLHWDDIDYCIRIRNEGWRVVAVLDAPAFHVAEKGYSPAVSYYNFRNSLLVQAKYRKGTDLYASVFNILENYLTLTSYLSLLGHNTAAAHLFSAVRDFITMKFGKAGAPVAILEEGAVGKQVGPEFFSRYKRVLVFAVGPFEDVACAVKTLKSLGYPVQITVAVSADRAAVYNLPEVDSLITYDLFKSGLLDKIVTAQKIVSSGFACGITAGDQLPMPFAFLLRKNLQFDRKDASFRFFNISPSKIWKVLASVVLGKALALAYLFPVLKTCKAIKAESRY